MKCNDRLLIQEIEKGPSDPTSEFLSRHVADCPRCQQRMIELTATNEWWTEAATVLRETSAESSTSGSIVIAIDSSASEINDDAHSPADVDEVTLDFLGAPTHPEMLGRLGRYEIERLIGAGGMGIVFKAFDTELHRVVAIKVLAPQLAHSGAARRRFAREAQAAAAVVHENVIPIYNVETDDKLPYLVMQYVPGSSLQSRVDTDGPLSVDETLRIGAQIAEGLSAAHGQGLIHRDVKPANILLSEDVDRVLISDFGLARAVDDASLTRSGIVAGTPHYMSPEQARGVGIDCRSDLFGLGSVLYFMCTGRPPFRADGALAVLNRICHSPHRPVFEVNSSIPWELSRLIDRLLTKTPDKRIESADEVSRELNELLTTWRTPGMRRMLSRARRPLRIHRPRLTFAALAATASLLTFGWWLWLENRRETLVQQPNSFVVASPLLDSPPRHVAATPAATRDELPFVLPSDGYDEAIREIDVELQTLESLKNARTSDSNTIDRWIEHDTWTERLQEIESQLPVN